MTKAIIRTQDPLDSPVKQEKNVPAAPTNAARIGVLKSRRTCRHRGIFYVRHHGITPYGRSVRGIARCAGPLTRYANLHGAAHPDWRQGERFEATVVKEAVMAAFARRARRALSVRPYHAAPAICRPTRQKPAMPPVYREKPRQLIKCVWGLRGTESNYGLTVIFEDTTLMDMDAPQVMPAGSHISHRSGLAQYPEGYSVRESVVFRDDFTKTCPTSVQSAKGAV